MTATTAASVFAANTTVFTAVAAENTDKTALTNTAATSVKFSSHRSKMSSNAQCGDLDVDNQLPLLEM